MPETCANCHRPIGDLETAHVWREHIVCGECLGRLRSSEIGYASPAPSPPASSALVLPELREELEGHAASRVLSEHRREEEKSMHRGRRSLGAALFLGGVVLLFIVPPAGIVLLIVGFLIWAAGVKL
jgi:hypothetical protein